MSVVVVCDRDKEIYACTRCLVMCVCGSRSMSLRQLHTCSFSENGSGRHGSLWTRIELASTYTHSVASVFNVHIAAAVYLPAALRAASLQASMESFRPVKSMGDSLGGDNAPAGLRLGGGSQSAGALALHAASGGLKRLRSRGNLEQASASTSVRDSNSIHGATDDGDENAGADGAVDVDGGRANTSRTGASRCVVRRGVVSRTLSSRKEGSPTGATCIARSVTAHGSHA